MIGVNGLRTTNRAYDAVIQQVPEQIVVRFGDDALTLRSGHGAAAD